jgi:type IV pilus assembly protein PilY1
MTRHFFANRLRGALAASTLALLLAPSQAQTLLADQPVFSTLSVPGNLALALSVEFPTAISVAHIAATYSSASTYLGYFDPGKCYSYHAHATDDAQRYFVPASLTSTRTCNGLWSGNFLNWATMQTIDPFRWALTGGYRSTDQGSMTILEKAIGSNQGGDTNFPNRALSDSATIAAATPFGASGWNNFKMRIRTLGNKMQFTRNGTVGTGVATVTWDGGAVNDNTVYLVSIRVRVCDATNGLAWLESNCVKYPNGNYKPTGLIQQYSDRITFSAFGYFANGDFTTDNQRRDGAVLRARQTFVGPTKPVPGGLPVANSAAEWDGNTGEMIRNPQPADVTATNTTFTPSVNVDTSGVMNYLNKFGLSAQVYKTYDPVSELFYATLRYYRNLGNVPEWSSMTGLTAAKRTTLLDNAPVITTWDDPIKYSCQKNFVLGIGDVNTNQDFNVPGGAGSNEPAMPALVSTDPMVPDARTWTNRVGVMHGLGNSLGSASIGNGSYLMAGLAYYANTTDLRADMAGKQTVQTYWLDVMEYQAYANSNQYYLAAKYGGFTVPDGYDTARTADITAAWWRSNTDLVNGTGSQIRPDNYFTASRPDLMVAGLSKTFASIASKLKSYTTSFSTALPQVAASGVGSYATQFDAKLWSGELVASATTFDGNTGEPALTEAWKFSTKLEAQASGSGWDSGRVIASFNTSTKVGVPFRTGNLSSAQLTSLDTSYVSGNDSSNYLNYLRGDRKNEVSSAVTGSTKAYRDRPVLIGDIVNSKARAVGAPSAPYGDAANPGYSAFKAANSSRKTMVYVGTNQGMLHGVDGSLTGATAGKEVFAYVPGAVYAGPNNTPGTDGLQSIGRVDYVHYNLVDATPVIADVDFGRTDGGSGTADWRTVLIGSLGKGGRSVFALDVTNPAAITSEAIAASKVLWEFTDTDLGFTYGEPAVVKTRKYGWVVIFGSGYNNANGQGYIFIVNPRTGALLKKLSTGTGSTTAQAGLAHIQAFLLDLADGTADTVYAGDLLGNLWRFDLTSTSGDYPAPLKLAELKDASSAGLPITSRPLVVIQPTTNRRFVTVGTGRFLHTSDINNTQTQRFFAITDGQGAKFAKAADLPSGITFPIKSSNLKQLTDLTKKVTLDMTTQIGWYVDLGQLAGNGSGWRVISDATAFYGIVSFATMVPSSSSACDPTGISRIYAIDLGSGQSRLQNNVSYLDDTSIPGGVITDRRFYSVDGKARLLVCTDKGKCSSPAVSFNTSSGVRRLNWREVPLTQ